MNTTANIQSTPTQPSLTDWAADLQIGDHFVKWNSTYAYDLESGKRHDNIIDRTEGVVIGLGKPRPDSDGEMRTPVLFVRVANLARAIESGRPSTSVQEYYMLAEDAIRIYDRIEVDVLRSSVKLGKVYRQVYGDNLI